MKELGDEFLFLRNYPSDMYSLDGEGLKLKVQADDIKAVASPSFVSIRQQHHYFESTAELDVSALAVNESAGLVLLQNNLYNLRVEVDGTKCNMVICKDGEDKIVGSAPLSNIAKDGIVKLTIKVEGLNTKGYAGDEYLGEAEVSSLATEVAGGFVGCCIGLYASGNGQEGGYVTFKNFTYRKQA
jgi:alpha-N-arabinofuranosidase